MNIDIPYYKDYMKIEVPDSRVKAVIKTQHPGAGVSERQIVEHALNHPIESESLADLSAGRRCVLIITSDHTRPMPSRITMPLILEHVRKKNPRVKVKILIATGVHRATTKSELKDRFGEKILRNEEIVVHDAFDLSAMTYKGLLPSGGRLEVNSLVDWADLIVAEGFIEPHFFAGFSGGRKSILPGICSNKTIMYNHNSIFVRHPRAHAGMLEGNPIHTDMVYAARKAGLRFILNVALDENKKIIAAFSGDPRAAHERGCATVSGFSKADPVKADIVATSNGGYPLDQNIYQTVKSMSSAESCINPGGVMIVVSSCVDGHGGEGFYNWFANARTADDILREIENIPPEKTHPDQWQVQILARILSKCKSAIIVSRHIDPSIVKNMHMRHAETFEQALKVADDLLGYQAEIVFIPDGVNIILN